MEFISLELEFIPDPGDAGPQVEGINIQKFILFFFNLFPEILLIVNAEYEVGHFHGIKTRLGIRFSD